MNLSKAEGKSIVWQGTILKWQQLWEQENKRRHLFSISSKVTDSVNVCKRRAGRRREEVIIFRMRIGHTFLNSTLFILGKHQSGLWSCQEPETVQHVLISCRNYDRQRSTQRIARNWLGRSVSEKYFRSRIKREGKTFFSNF